MGPDTVPSLAGVGAAPGLVASVHWNRGKNMEELRPKVRTLGAYRAPTGVRNSMHDLPPMLLCALRMERRSNALDFRSITMPHAGAVIDPAWHAVCLKENTCSILGPALLL